MGQYTCVSVLCSVYSGCNLAYCDLMFVFCFVLVVFVIVIVIAILLPIALVVSGTCIQSRHLYTTGRREVVRLPYQL